MVFQPDSEYSIFFQPNEEINPFLPTLLSLVAAGYDLEGDVNFQKEQCTMEYLPNGRKITFFAKDSTGEILGSFVVDDRSLGTEGGACWNDLPLLLQDRIQQAGASIVSIGGIVVRKEFRRLGIAQQLVEEMLRVKEPSMVHGSTKSPALVRLRSKTLAEHGFRTFYGFQEVTPGTISSAPDLIRELLAHYSEIRHHDLSEGGSFFVEPHILPPDLPDTLGYDHNIRLAFQPILKAQLSVSDRTAIAPLISVKSSILEE